MSSMRFVFACALFTLLAACPEAEPTPGALDLSGVADARFGEEYLGQLAVVGYDGPARFELNSGEWPQGLEMNASGRITGTATWIEAKTVDVFVSGLSGIDDFVGQVTVAVTAEFVEGTFLGYEHDQFNNMIDHPSREFMSNIWVRITEVGIDDMSEWTMRPGIYLPGPNDTPEAGRGDDVRIGDIAFADLEWTFEDWEATEETQTFPSQGYPSVHLPEGEDPTISEDGVFAAGVDGGQGRFHAEHPDLEGEIDQRFQVVPPDWCPNGEHAGANAPGQCS